MTDELPTPFSLHATNRDLLEEARELFNSAGERTGEIFEENVITDIFFDPDTAIRTAFSILGVISTVGGAIRFIDWIITKVQDFKRNESTDVIVINYLFSATIHRRFKTRAIPGQLRQLKV